MYNSQPYYHPLPVLFCLLLFSSPVESNKTVYLWQGHPIKITLEVDTERSVSVKRANNLQVGVPSELSGILELEVINNYLWLMAHEQFKATRIIVIAEPFGRLILEIEARYDAVDSKAIEIAVDENHGQIDPSEVKFHNHGFITLTRWVIQQFYSPKRLLRDLEDVIRVPIKQNPVDIFRCANRIPTFCGGGVTATPIASWRSPNHFITAVRIVNNLSESIVLDPRELNGAWRTASFVHTKLFPHGRTDDSTILVVISDLPFFNSLI